MKQAEKSRQSREQIILAAAKEFGSTSFEHASLNKICQNNHISKGKIYHHFESKEALFLACLSYAVDKLIEYSSLTFNDTIDLEKNFHAMFVSRQKFVMDYPHIAIFLFRAFKASPKRLQNEIDKQHLKYRAAISKTLLSAFSPYAWFHEEQLPIFTEMFVMASNRVHEMGMQEWDANDPPEKQKKVIDKSLIIFDNLVHIFLYGIIPLENR